MNVSVVEGVKVNQRGRTRRSGCSGHHAHRFLLGQVGDWTPTKRRSPPPTASPNWHARKSSGQRCSRNDRDGSALDSILDTMLMVIAGLLSVAALIA